MNTGLAGKTVIVTGGASNIGWAITQNFAREGANVVVADIDKEQGQESANQASALGAGGSSIYIYTDVTKPETIEEMVKGTLATFSHIDVLVNNAGYMPPVGLFVEQSVEEWRKAVAITYWGTINCTRTILPHMIERKSGNIINIGSDAGRMGEFQQAVHSADKAAVIGLTKAIAREVGRYGIRVNVVCPSLTIGRPETSGHESTWAGETGAKFTPELQERIAKQYPLRCLGRPEDIAPTVVFLASDGAGWITGQTLSVNGGYIMY